MTDLDSYPRGSLASRRWLQRERWKRTEQALLTWEGDMTQAQYEEFSAALEHDYERRLDRCLDDSGLLDEWLGRQTDRLDVIFMGGDTLAAAADLDAASQ